MTTTTSTAQTVEFAQLDPASLVIGTNARVDVTIAGEFVEDIAEHGVMQAITAYRAEDGSVVVLQGQRRTRAAVEAGLATVPVMIVAAPTDEADRIIRQVAENDRRGAMTDRDRVGVAHDLALIGYTAAQIAKRTRRPRAEVDAALAVDGHSVAERIGHDLTLEQAAALAEVEDDPEAVEAVEHAIENGWNVEQVIAKVRAEREEAAILADSIAKVRAVTGMDVEPYGRDSDVEELQFLRTRQGDKISTADHLACPGSVVMVRVRARYDREQHPDRMPYAIVCACRDHAKHGHRTIWDSSLGGSQKKQSKEERAAIIAGNREWRAATTVRRAWLAKLAKTTKLPKGAEKIMAAALATDSAGDATGWALLTGRGKIDRWGQEYRDALAAIQKMTPARAAVASLVMCLAETEKTTSDTMTWRSPHAGAAGYLRTLAGWGYTLSEAEDTFCRMSEQAAKAEQEADAQQGETEPVTEQ